MFRIRKDGTNRLGELISALEDLKKTVSCELEAKCAENDNEHELTKDFYNKLIIESADAYIKQIDAVIEIMRIVIDSRRNTYLAFLAEITKRAKEFTIPSLIMNRR